MIVIGVDVHKQSLTAVAVDEAGRMLDEQTVALPAASCSAWAQSLGSERLWAVEDCRQLTRGARAGAARCRRGARAGAAEADGAGAAGGQGARQVRPDRRARCREGGACGSRDLGRPRPDEGPLRELKLLVDHRDDLVDERRRAQQRLRWHLHQLDPSLAVPRALDRASPPRPRQPLARPPRPEVQVRIARELVVRCRSLTRTIGELDRELEQRTAETAPALLELPGCGAITAAKLLAEIGPIDRFKTDAQLARHGGVAPLEASSGKRQRHRLDRGGNRQLNCALYRIAITQARYHPAARAYLERKQAEGKSRREAIRCLKRLLVRVVFNTLKRAPP